MLGLYAMARTYSGRAQARPRGEWRSQPRVAGFSLFIVELDRKRASPGGRDRQRNDYTTRRAVVVFIDESGFSLIPYSAKTWAPVGKTPVLIHEGRWPKFSAISGVTPSGHLYFRVHEYSVRGPQVVAFLHHLLRHIRRRPIMLFWGSGPHHRSKVVRAYIDEQPRLEVHRFRGHSPELNPDEWVWSHLKKHELASYAPHDVMELRRGIRLGVMRMRDRPRLIRSFVRAAHLYDGPTDRTRYPHSGRIILGRC